MSTPKANLITAGMLAIASVLPAHGALTTYYSHYEQPSDVPSGFYGGGSAQHIEDMEAGVLRFGISANTGGIIPPDFSGYIDSVATDGNPSDPLGNRGHSWFAGGSVTFTFDAPHAAAGLVWTDGGFGCDVFAEFFRGGTSLGMISLLALGDFSNFGSIEEDTFIGAFDPLGIDAIRVWNSSGGLEIDHVQFGETTPVPEPSTYLAGALLFLPFGAHLIRRLRNRS